MKENDKIEACEENEIGLNAEMLDHRFRQDCVGVANYVDYIVGKSTLDPDTISESDQVALDTYCLANLTVNTQRFDITKPCINDHYGVLIGYADVWFGNMINIPHIPIYTSYMSEPTLFGEEMKCNGVGGYNIGLCPVASKVFEWPLYLAIVSKIANDKEFTEGLLTNDEQFEKYQKEQNEKGAKG